MFSGKTEIRLLRPDDITPQILLDINGLLKKQHSQAREVTEDILRRHMGKSRVAVAWMDGRVVGMGVLVKVFCISHTFVGLHNVVVHKHCDENVLSLEITEFLLNDSFVRGVDFIEARAWSDQNSYAEVLKALGFRPKNNLFRLRFKRTGR